MRDEIDIHDQKHRLEVRLARLGRRGLTQTNTEQIRAFADQCIAEGLSSIRVSKYVYLLTKLAAMSQRPLTQWDKAEVTAVVVRIEQLNRSSWNKHDYKVTLKKFFRWLRKTEEGYPDEVRWLRTSLRRQQTKLPEELLTEDDIKRMVNAAETRRDRAFIFALYESGCRIGELGSLRLRHVVFDDFGCQLIVRGKTGARRVRLIGAVPDLAAWVNAHPLRDDPSAPLWVNSTGPDKRSPMNYAAVRALVLRVASAAGVKKRVYPHLFRHSRATHLASHLTESQLNAHLGWVQGSDMPSTYVHLSGRDVDDALLKLHGVRKPDAPVRQEALAPRTCSRCEATNSPTARYCNRCRMPLDMQAAMVAEEERRPWDDLMALFVQDPRVQALWQEKLEEMKGRLDGAYPSQSGPAEAARAVRKAQVAATPSPMHGRQRHPAMRALRRRTPGPRPPLLRRP